MKIEIELTEHQVKMLKQYSEIYEEEKYVHWTSDPISVVEKKKLYFFRRRI